MNRIQKVLISVVAIASGIILGNLGMRLANPNNSIESPLSYFAPTPIPTPLPFLKYTFSSLREDYIPQTSQIVLEDILNQEQHFTAYRFIYTTDNKRMSGQINVPRTATPSAKFPVILMIRGYVPVSNYQTGTGTRNAAARLAGEGYVTVAPDFLGYGSSDAPDADSIGARLEKPRHLLDLMASLPRLTFVDPYRMGLWAHSNGGQIVLSLLQISGKPYPTTLWAPVSKPFPYSILFYTDESPDQGKALRKAVADFESHYDVFDFSIDRYWEWISAPIQVHQGTNDDAIPTEWSNDLVKSLREQELSVNYFTYPAADHDLRPVWDTVVLHDIDFFNTHLAASNSSTLTSLEQ